MKYDVEEYMEPSKRHEFRVLGIRSISIEAISHSFFTALWTMLDVEPLKEITWLDQDIVSIGTEPRTVVCIVPIRRSSGFVDLWVDNLEAVKQLLEARKIPISNGPHSSGRVCPGFNISPSDALRTLKHPIKIRFSQADNELITSLTR